MISIYLAPLANHLWQSTLFAAVAALLAFFLRRDRAALRYAVWFAASVKFLVPSATWPVPTYATWAPACVTAARC